MLFNIKYDQLTLSNYTIIKKEEFPKKENPKYEIPVLQLLMLIHAHVGRTQKKTD